MRIALDRAIGLQRGLPWALQSRSPREDPARTLGKIADIYPGLPKAFLKRGISPPRFWPSVSLYAGRCELVEREQRDAVLPSSEVAVWNGQACAWRCAKGWSREEGEAISLLLAVAVLYATALKDSAQQAQQDGPACCLCVRIPVCLHCVHQPSHAPESVNVPSQPQHRGS